MLTCIHIFDHFIQGLFFTHVLSNPTQPIKLLYCVVRSHVKSCRCVFTSTSKLDVHCSLTNGVNKFSGVSLKTIGVDSFYEIKFRRMRLVNDEDKAVYNSTTVTYKLLKSKCLAINLQ